MMKFFCKLLCLWLFGLTVAAAVSAPPAPDEKRPQDGIYDPSEAISPHGRSALIREATSIRDSSGIDMLVVVVDRLNQWEPQALADDLANRWGYHGGRALVLWVPEKREMNPWISVSGMVRSEIPTVKLEAIIERAKARGRTDQRVDEGVRRTVVSLGEDLRFAAGNAMRKQPEQKSPKLRIRTIDAVMVLIRDSKKIVVAGVAGLGVLALLVYGMTRIFWRVRMTVAPRKFPDVSWKRRFGAPYGGIVYTSSPKKRPHSHEIH